MSLTCMIDPYQYISIVGMEKNTGKTTTLNRLIQEISNKKIIGLSSIGRDGEEVDVVTHTAKPRIYVLPNTIIATARDCLKSCDITKEILYTTKFSTPLGNVVIVRALSAGYIDLAGSSYNSQNRIVFDKMKNFGCDMILLDGALSRNSSAVISQGMILSTGASVSKNMQTVVDKTTQMVQMFSLPSVTGILKENIINLFENSPLGIFNDEGEYSSIDVTGILEVQTKIKTVLNEHTTAIAVRSAITDLFIENLIKHRKHFRQVDCIALDGTKFFVSHSNYQKALACGITFKVLNPLNLLFVSYNPYSPKGNYYFDDNQFQSLLQQNISVPVLNMRE